jgi:Translation-initiation factor 2
VLQAVATEERAQRISRARTLRSEEYRLARAAASRVDELAADATVNAEGVRIASIPSNVQQYSNPCTTMLLVPWCSALRAPLSSALNRSCRLQEDVEDESDQRQLLIVVKADVQGSVEAVCEAVARLSSDKVRLGPLCMQLGRSAACGSVCTSTAVQLGVYVTQVRVKLLFSGVGPVSASDVALASASGATILAFNVRQPPPAVEAEAKRQGIQICTQRIIYRLLEEVGFVDFLLCEGTPPASCQFHAHQTLAFHAVIPAHHIDQVLCCSCPGGRPDGRQRCAGGPGGCAWRSQHLAGDACGCAASLAVAVHEQRLVSISG